MVSRILTAEIVLTTDSQYVRKGITEWIEGWKKKNWQTAACKPVKNEDLWGKIDALAHVHTIYWLWVEGHSGHAENELLDDLANSGIDELKNNHKSI